MRSRLLVCLALLAVFVVPVSAHAALGDLFVVSRADGPAGATGDGFSYVNARAVSADGRFVAFISYADNFGGPYTADRNVYRRDLALGRTEVVSRANGAAGAIGDDNSFGASISADGNRIAFASGADNLSTADNDAYTNIFVRDMNAGTTSLASRVSGVLGGAANGSSIIPVISGDGNLVAFQSAATNIDTSLADGNGFTDVYVRDLVAYTTRLVSKTTGGTLGDKLTGVGDVSFDGRFISMDSEATNLGGTLTPGTSNVYLRDRVANTTTLISQPSGATNVGGTESSGPSSMTTDGQKIVFGSRSTNLVPGTPGGIGQIYMRDIATNTTTLLSRSPEGAPADAEVETPRISTDGSFVTFAGLAKNLAGDGGAYRQAFVRFLDTGKTVLISRSGETGPPGDYDDSEDATPGYSLRFVLFESQSKNLIPGLTTSPGDILMRDVRVPDPAPPAGTVTGKKFTAKVSKKAFKVKVTSGGNATQIAGTATISVPKSVIRSGKVKVKLKTLAFAASKSAHTLKFKLTSKQNRRVRKALRTKRTRIKVTLSLRATSTGGTGKARISGKLRR